MSTVKQPTSKASHGSFEPYAPRSEAQRSRLARIAALTAGPTSTKNRPSESSNAPNFSKNAPTTSLFLTAMSNNMKEDFVYEDANQLYQADNEKENSFEKTISTTLDFAQATSEHLTKCIQLTTPVKKNLKKSTEVCQNLMNRHSELLQHSGELSAAADRLQMEETILSKKAQEIGAPLQHYDAMDKMGVLMGVLFKDQGNTVVRGLAKVKVDSEEYTVLLDQIDLALAFFMEQYQELSVHHANNVKKILMADENGNGPNTAQSNANMTERERRRADREKKRKESQYQQSPLTGSVVEYYKRSIALHEAALFLIREAVVDRIAQTTKDIMDALNLTSKAVPADKLEASLIYTRFHGISSRSNTLVKILRDRLQMDPNQSYLKLLTLCQSTYAKSRERLLKTTVQMHMNHLQRQHGLISMTRLASVFSIRICTIETMLYLDFFAGDYKSKEDENQQSKNDAVVSSDQSKNQKELDHVKETSNIELNMRPTYKRKKTKSEKAATLATQDPFFQKHLSNLNDFLHKTIRRALITVKDLDSLCQIVAVLREEWQMANSSKNTIATALALSGVIQDAQERLIFCANAALSKEVIRFKASPADLDYPNKLQKKISGETNESDNNDDKKKQDEESSEEDKANGTKPNSSADDFVQEQFRVYEAWFPPMRSVLKILSKIFRVVEPQVFEDIAQQSVISCTKSLKEGASKILATSGIIHADLFLVKHLLILREQLSPFDIQLRAVERQLDFSDTGKAVTKFLANRNRKLFSMTNENALVTLMREGVSVQESSVDSKRDLEDSLRSACNDFIDHTSTTLAKALLHFVSECKNVISNTGDLKAASCMNVDSVMEALTDTSTRITDQTGFVSLQMSLYLENQATQSILMKPVARKIMRALEDSKRYITQVGGEDGVWDAENMAEATKLIADIEVKVKGMASLSR